MSVCISEAECQYMSVRQNVSEAECQYVPVRQNVSMCQ